jgi:NitT/TauT family transport system permease protein
LLAAMTRSRRSGETRAGAAFLASALRPETLGSAVVLVAFLAAWEWGPGLLGIPSYILPTASECWQELLHMIVRDRLLFHIGITALEVAVGFGLGALLGMVIGYVLGMSSTAEVVLSP